MDVRVLVDRPIVEMFVNRGRAAFVSADANFSLHKTAVTLFNNGTDTVIATGIGAFGMGCGWTKTKPCPDTGCPGCGGCKWPYQNNTEPDPTRPYTSTLDNVTTRECEARCTASSLGCVGFTRKGTSCWFYTQVSGRFSHGATAVSWHPNPSANRV